MSLSQFIITLNEWGHASVPFFFMVDFEMKKPVAVKISEIDPAQILFSIGSYTNAPAAMKELTPVPNVSGCFVRMHPLPLADYHLKFSKVLSRLQYGDSFLTNLTCKTEVEIDDSLHALFTVSRAKYKLLYKDQFLVFSPETFVQIRDGKIFSYPMKGTIDANVEGAAEKVLNDRKELAEHVTIVDLIRNDLSLVASDVKVTRFRYLDMIRTNHKNLLQVSSEVVGRLSSDYRSHIGEIILKLLPAGSVSGAPKPKTVEIIRDAEMEERGYYTGVFGYFDGVSLDSAVMIRYIEHESGRFYYRSGGGITAQSEVHSEYQEVIDKIYVPVD